MKLCVRLLRFGFGCTVALTSPRAPNCAARFTRAKRTPLSSLSAGGAAWFRFSELCARPLGAADYMALSQAYHTVFLEGVPALSMQASCTAAVAV